MKTLVKNYSFNKTTRQVTFNSLPSIDLEQVLIITNVTSHTIIYNFADPALGGSVSGNVLTLVYNTSAMSDADELQIFIDIPNSTELEQLASVLSDGLEGILHQLQGMKKAQGIPDSAGRLRVNVEAGSLSTVSTVTTVGNMTSMGGLQTSNMNMSMTNQAWGNLRNKINAT